MDIKNLSNKLAISAISIITLLAIGIPSFVSAQGVTESQASASETSTRDPISIINEIRSLLSQTNTAYSNQNFSQAEELATTAYLDHYEFLEAPLAQRNATLMETTEILLREDLVTDIRNQAPVATVSGLINTINNNLDQAEALFR
ncbi:MAG: hypothetical protein M3162_01605 [Thermoproteota archaeon]|nr:hypothetical protein [Thermoproteota archaeon]